MPGMQLLQGSTLYYGIDERRQSRHSSRMSERAFIICLLFQISYYSYLRSMSKPKNISYLVRMSSRSFALAAAGCGVLLFLLTFNFKSVAVGTTYHSSTNVIFFDPVIMEAKATML